MTDQNTKPVRAKLPPLKMDDNTPSTSQNPPELKPKKSAGLLRRLTNKLKPPAAAPLPASPKSPTTASNPRAGPSLPNDFVSKERRQAALRARGLLPPDLSQREKELDEQSPAMPTPASPDGDGESAARKIQQEWLAKNNSEDSGSRPTKAAYPETLGRPNFSKPRLTVDVQEDVEEDGTNSEELQHLQPSVAASVPSAYHTARTDSPFAIDSQVISTSPTQDTFEETALPDISADADLNAGYAHRLPPPIVITTTASPHQGLSQQSTLPTRSVSNPAFSLTKQHSLSNKTSLPALSPTRTSSSDSWVATPAIEVGNDQPVAVARSFSTKSRGSSKHQVKEEPIPELPPNTVHFGTVDETTTVDQSGPDEFGAFEAYVERRQKRERRRSTGLVDKRSSVASNRLSGDFGLTVPNGMTTSASAPGQLGGPSPKKFASLRRTMSKLGPGARSTPQPRVPPLPTTGSGLVRRPTVAATLPSRARMLNEMKGIEDEESRRLCEVAFF